MFDYSATYNKTIKVLPPLCRCRVLGLRLMHIESRVVLYTLRIVATIVPGTRKPPGPGRRVPAGTPTTRYPALPWVPGYCMGTRVVRVRVHVRIYAYPGTRHVPGPAQVPVAYLVRVPGYSMIDR